MLAYRGQLLDGHLVHVVEPAEAGLVQVQLGVGVGVRLHLALDLHGLGHGGQLRQQLGADGEGVAAGQRQHLARVPADQ